MAAADRNYSEVEINPETGSYGEQSTIQAEGNYSYFIPQETPETFLSGIQELGKTLLNNSEEMERRMTARFRLQIDRLDDKIWRLDNPAVGRGGPGEEPEVTEYASEPEVVRESPGNHRPIEKPLITPAPFDGNTSWDDCQVQFELISELNGWNKKVMAIYLAASLSGCARAVLADLDERSRKDYFTLKEALALRFGNGGKTELYRAQLRNRVKGRDETPPELAQAIQRLVRQAHPEAPSSVREVIERDHFVDAILDTEIRWKVLQARPRTVQEALAVAIEVEAFQASEKQHQRQGRFTTNVIATQVAEMHQETFDSSISKILAEMKKDREEQRQLLEDFMKKMTSPGRLQKMGAWGAKYSK